MNLSDYYNYKIVIKRTPISLFHWIYLKDHPEDLRSIIEDKTLRACIITQ